MRNRQTSIRVLPTPWNGDELAIHIGTMEVTAGGKEIYGKVHPLVMSNYDPMDPGTYPSDAPALSITHEEAQQFMDELYRAGIRPRDGSGSVGQITAKDAHLADLRRIVFQNIPPLQ